MKISLTNIKDLLGFLNYLDDNEIEYQAKDSAGYIELDPDQLSKEALDFFSPFYIGECISLGKTLTWNPGKEIIIETDNIEEDAKRIILVVPEALAQLSDFELYAHSTYLYLFTNGKEYTPPEYIEALIFYTRFYLQNVELKGEIISRLRHVLRGYENFSIQS